MAGQIKINKKIIILGICIFALIFCWGKRSHGDNDSITNLTQEKQSESDIAKKIKELEEKAKIYQQIIDIKRKQQTTLGNQISIMEAEISQLEAETELNKEKIEIFNSQIEQLRVQIEEKEDAVKAQKKILAELIQTYYEYNQQALVSILLSENELSRFMVRSDRITQIGDGIKSMLDTIQALKTDLENEKKSFEDKKKEVMDLQYKMEEKMSLLDSSKAQKEILITQTQGEENRYQDLLSRVEEQKKELLGDIDERYAANTTEIDALFAALERPTAGLASTSWYYSQKDSRWKNDIIGISNSKMKDYGCAVSSVAMIFTYHGSRISPQSLAKQPIYYKDLIVWPLSWSGSKIVLSSTYGHSHGNINWSVVDKELAKGNPVVVFVRARGNAGHYVVIHHKNKDGRYVVHDPYWGANIYLNSTIKLLSKLYGTSVSKNSIDQMILYSRK
ncbi:MAG: C39 family peptidase [Candidatus Moranbacteria bacterium]|nr:C39 family peptidase [Candidatus Moranbacteria bacterium]